MKQRRRCKGSNILIHCMGHFRLENGVFFPGNVLVTRQEFRFAEFDGLGLDENDFGLRVGVIPEGYIFEIQ